MRKNSLRTCLTVVIVSVKWDAMYVIVNKNAHVTVLHITAQKRTPEKILKGIMEKDLCTCQEETASI